MTTTNNKKTENAKTKISKIGNIIAISMGIILIFGGGLILCGKIMPS